MTTTQAPPANPDHTRMREALAVEEARGKAVCPACLTIHSPSTTGRVVRQSFGVAMAGGATLACLAAIKDSRWIEVAIWVVVAVAGVALCLLKARCTGCGARRSIPATTPRGGQLVLESLRRQQQP